MVQKQPADILVVLEITLEELESVDGVKEEFTIVRKAYHKKVRCKPLE